MPVSVTMPRLGESVTEGTVTRWLKNEGDHVDADEPLLEVSTDKVDTEVPSPAAGTVLSIKVQEDETVEIGVELAVIGDAADDSGGDDGGGASDAGGAQADDQDDADESAEPADQPAEDTEDAEDAEEAEAEQPEPQPAQAEDEPQQKAEAAAPEPQAAPAAEPQESEQRAPASGDDEDDDVAGTYVTPLVRRLASEHGVDLGSIKGTGVGGRIRKSDVLAAAGNDRQAQTSAAAPAPAAAPAHAAPAPAAEPAPPPAAAPAARPAAATATATAAKSTPAEAPAAQRGHVEPMSRMRQVIASRMVESLQVSAQLTTVVEVDVTKIARLRDQAKDDFAAREGVKLSFLPFFAVAAIEALKAHPVVNASIDVQAKTITYHDAEHLGIAVDTERGLAVPVIHDAGDLNLGGLARKIADLADRTRANKVSPDELGGGTFTITNTGSRGALFDTPIINQPQVAILGTGAVVKRPVVISDADLGETIAVRSMVYLALSYDHRIVDGADAARFLTTMKHRLEAGAFERALGLG
jgi:pyruvate dehydrogenase E2 component (dihydrolipoyllysine-residue acetyltransferase)